MTDPTLPTDSALLFELTERCEQARNQFDLDMHDQAAICAAFGVVQQRLPKAGWKRWWPDSNRWGMASRPASSLDDLRHLLEAAGCLPEMLHSCPWIAAAAALRAIAAQGGTHA